MNHKTFIKFLLITIGACAATMVLFNWFLPVSKHINFLVAATAFYAALSYIVFILGQKSVEIKTGEIFMYIIVINVFVKLVASFLMVFVYVRIYMPEDKLFVIPFLTIYLLFTILETYFLSILAKSSK